MTKLLEPSGSSLRYRTFILAFSHSDGFWAKYLTGFTHVTLLEEFKDHYTVIEFGRRWCPTYVISELPNLLCKNYTCLRIKVRINRGEHLFKFLHLQTCTSLVQTICGFNIGAVFANTLYNRLSFKSSEWLAKKGIVLVEALSASH